MESSSNASQKMKSLVIALLTLWSLISLIIIVVWSTSPDLKSSAKCRADLGEMTQELEDARMSWEKEKVDMQKQLKEAAKEQERRGAEILLLLGRLNVTNTSLEDCRQETVKLNMNISVLQENMEQLRRTEANLTAQLRLQEGQIEALQQNLSQAFLQSESCHSLKVAAENQMMAAKSQTKACESNQQYLQKQLQKCKAANTEAPVERPQKNTSAPAKPLATSALIGISVLLLLLCNTLHLITCER